MTLTSYELNLTNALLVKKIELRTQWIYKGDADSVPQKMTITLPILRGLHVRFESFGGRSKTRVSLPFL